MNANIKCPHCEMSWDIEKSSDGSYLRESLVSIAEFVSAHLRAEHGDDEKASKMDAWATTPPPWLTGD